MVACGDLVSRNIVRSAGVKECHKEKVRLRVFLGDCVEDYQVELDGS